MDTSCIALVVGGLAFLAVEATVRHRRRQPLDLREGRVSIAVGSLSYAVGLASQFAFTVLAASLLLHFAPWRLSAADPLVWIVFFVIDDFVNYVVHVATHKVPMLWAAHVVHHSAEDLSLISSVRLSPVEGLYQPMLVLWAPLLGFPLVMYGPMMALALAIGAVSHTQLLGRNRWLDGWLVTPSNHRVHHGVNPQYIDRNYGSSLIVWDRLFHTYEPEVEPPVFGTTTPLPATVAGTAFGGYPTWVRSLSARSAVLLGAVGFGLSIGACAAIDPRGLGRNDGICYYDTRLLTFVPYALALASVAAGLFLAARRVDGRRLRRWLQVLGALTAMAAIPHDWSGQASFAHMVVGCLLFSLAFLLAVTATVHPTAVGLATPDRPRRAWATLALDVVAIVAATWWMLRTMGHLPWAQMGFLLAAMANFATWLPATTDRVRTPAGSAAEAPVEPFAAATGLVVEAERVLVGLR